MQIDINDVLLVTAFIGAIGLYFWSSSSSSTSAAIKKIQASTPNGSLKPPAANTVKAPSPKPAKTRSIVQKMTESGKNVVIFFGSQTGTAEDFAGRLAKEGQQYGLNCMTADPEDYDMDDLAKLPSNLLAMFVVATYGEGEPTDNAVNFIEWLKSEDGADLSNLRFTVFGLGNKTYEHFNAIARIIDNRLVELGATRVAEKGEGDDDGSLEDDFVNWKEKMWPLVCEFFNIDMSKVSKESVRSYALKDLEDVDSSKVFVGEIGPKVKPGQLQNRHPYDAKNPYYSTLTVRKDLTSSESSVASQGNVVHRVVHAELSAPKSENITYKHGDHVAIYPANNTDLVLKYAKLLGLDDKLDNVFSLTAIDASAPKKNLFPCPTTYKAALSHYLDLTTPPRSNVVRLLAEHATEENDKRKLELMASSSAEGRELYHSFIVEGARNIADVLSEFPSVKVPADFLFEVMPRLQPRYYSISSSPKAHPDSIHVTFSVVQFRAEGTPDQLRFGVATNWLDQLPIGERIPIFIRSSNFKLPRSSKTPVVMVGPGTGLAPFRGFIQERASVPDQERGETVLFFGSRHKDHDYLYSEELEEALNSKVLTNLELAFSRQIPGQKVYVQHKVMEQKELIWELLGKKGGYFYVCGDAKNMARDVQNALIQIAKEVGGKDQVGAENWVKDLRKNKRYLEDVWA